LELSYSIRAPEALTTFSYLPSSLFTNAANRSGGLAIDSAKRPAKRAFSSFDSIASTKALFSRAVTSGGRCAGPKMPNQVSMSKRARPSERPGLGDRRHVGHRARALRGRDRERLELAGLDVGRRGRQVVEVEVDLAAEQRELRRVAAGVRDVDHEDARLRLEHLAGQVAGAAVAARAVVELARVALRVRHQVGDARDAEPVRHLGAHHQHVRHLRDAGDRREVADRVVRQLRVEPGIDRVRRDGAHDDRRAVGRGLGHGVGAEVAAGAGTVLDDHRAEAVLHLLGERAGDDVERAARRIGHDEAERPGLRQRRQRPRRRDRAGGKRGEGEPAPHRRARRKRTRSAWRNGMRVIEPRAFREKRDERRDG
jgi:hypothetical protein